MVFRPLLNTSHVSYWLKHLWERCLQLGQCLVSTVNKRLLSSAKSCSHQNPLWTEEDKREKRIFNPRVAMLLQLFLKYLTTSDYCIRFRSRELVFWEVIPCGIDNLNHTKLILSFKCIKPHFAIDFCQSWPTTFALSCWHLTCIKLQFYLQPFNFWSTSNMHL